MQALREELRKARQVHINLLQFIDPRYFIANIVKMYYFPINCIDVTTLIPDSNVRPAPKLPPKAGPLATKRRAVGDRRRVVKRAPTQPASTPTVNEPSGASEVTSEEQPNVPNTEPVISETAMSNDQQGIEPSNPAAPKQKRTRQASACMHCRWNHYFGVTMCPTPAKAENPEQAVLSKFIPAATICDTCGWVHNIQQTPCRTPAKSH